MNEHKLKQKPKSRMIGAALVIAVCLLGGAFVNNLGKENVAVIWLTTAVYMSGPLVAALIVWPLVEVDGWLFVTAVLLSLAIVIPWAFLNPTVWATEQMPQPGQWANVLFFVLLVTNVSAGRPSRRLWWALTGFYLLIMLVLPLLF